MNFDYSPAVTTNTTYANDNHYSLNLPAPHEILNENIATIAGTQILPLTLVNTQQILQNPDAGFDYFIVKVKTLALCNLPREVLKEIGLYLNVMDLKALGRAVKDSKDYASFMPTLFSVYCAVRKTRIFPTDRGTIICSGGALERVYFTGYDEYGITNPEGKQSFIDLALLITLGNRTVKSITQYAVAIGIPNHGSSIFLLTEEGEVFRLIKGECVPFEKAKFPSPVLEIACYRYNLYFRTKRVLYFYKRDFYIGPKWKVQILNIPDVKKIEKIIAQETNLAVKFKDRTFKVFDIRHLENIEFDENKSYLSSVNTLWKTKNWDSPYISTNDKFFKIEANGSLFEYQSLRGHKVITLFREGKWVLTEGGCLWQKDAGDCYHQRLTQYNISHGFATSDTGFLFSTQGKLHYVGSDDYRCLVSHTPDNEYLVPTQVLFKLSPKKMCGNWGSIWFFEDQDLIHMKAEKDGNFTAYSFTNYGLQSRMDYNCRMFSAWNTICPEYNFIQSTEYYTELHLIIREIIKSSKNPKELIQLLQEERSKIDSVTANRDEVLKFIELLNSSEFN